MLADLALRLALALAVVVAPLASGGPEPAAAPARSGSARPASVTVADTTTDRAAPDDVAVDEVELVVPAATDATVAAAPDAVAEEPSAVGTTTDDVLVADALAPADVLVPAGDEPAGDAAERVVTDVLETDGFQTVGMTWPVGTDPSGLEPQVRTRAADGTWSPWQELADDESAPDPGTADAGGTRAGTDSLWVGEADAVQVSFAATAEAGPADLRLALVDVPVAAPTAAGALWTGSADVVPSSDVVPSADPAPSGDTPTVEVPASDPVPGSDAVPSVDAVPSADVASAPRVISREEWGARQQVCQPSTATALVGAVVHHTAGSNGYSTVAEAMQQIRGDQAYHIDGRGWCDIGYNFIVDKWGNIYEGRDNSLTKPVIGVHAGGFNTGTVGVSMLGTYGSLPSTATQTAVAQIIGWRLGYYGIDPSGTMSYYTYGGENSRYPANTRVTLPRVIGHRDVAYTACPGDGGYAALSTIRKQASSYSYGQRFVQARAVVTAMYQDLLGRAPDAAGLASWSAMLAGGSGQPALVAALTSSEEYRRLRITLAYREALGRDPEPAGMTYWYDRIRSGSATVDDVKRRFYDSDEYARRAGGTPEGYVDLLYRTMFERPASERESAYWSAQIEAIGRSRVVDAIWFSYEAALYRAGGYYRTFLQREPDAAGQAGWARLLLSDGEGAVRIGIAGSEEYRLLALRRYPATTGA